MFAFNQKDENMKCEKCNKEIQEGNFVQVPCHKQTNAGIIATVIHVITCDECCKTITHRITGSAKVIDAEIIPTGEQK
jgi:hypothetical protein